jgi:hypothetical protein
MMNNDNNDSINGIYFFLMVYIFIAMGYKFFIIKDHDCFNSYLKMIHEYNLCEDEINNNVELLEHEQGNTEEADKAQSNKEKEKEQKFEEKYITQYNDMDTSIALTEDFLEGLSNNFIMENTPIGNVIMCYNSKKESFVYYADNVIPYRFLEVLGRKYVCTFRCPQLYKCMDKEIEEAKRKIEEEKEELLRISEEEKEREQKKDENGNNSNNKEVKKNVFAKFKNYNTEVAKDVVISTQNQRDKTPKNNGNTKKDKSKTVILKEYANRYTCEGKMNNMPFLKKVDRKKIDKSYNLSFAEFKKMQAEKQNNV